MAIVRQMPELYLRGSLANVTMKNLTAEEVLFCHNLTELVANHDRMKKHRYQVSKVLGETIGADYRDDREIAEQEYKIAIWRAVVNLFYHRHYKFQCEACDATHRVVKTTGIEKPIDQSYTPCPVCNKVVVSDPGNTHFQIGQYVDHEEFQNSYKNFKTGIPSCDSTIKAHIGEFYSSQELDQQLAAGEIDQKTYDRRKQQFRYDNPDAIIDDENQMAKFFGEFVWGYFKQQLRENSRTEHRKKPTKVIGRADEIIVQEILSSASKLKIPVVYCPKTQPENGWFNINLMGLQTSLEFSYELSALLHKAWEHGVHVCIDLNTIRVKQDFDLEYIQSYITKSEHVIVMENDESISGEDSNQGFSIEMVSDSGGMRMETMDHTQTLEIRDTLEAIYSRLPDGDCQKVFRICQQNGPIYKEFTEMFDSDGEPKQAHIAKFLGVTTRAVKQHMQHIRHMCLAFGAIPQ
jgi:hypothetical protein